MDTPARKAFFAVLTSGYLGFLKKAWALNVGLSASERGPSQLNASPPRNGSEGSAVLFEVLLQDLGTTTCRLSLATWCKVDWFAPSLTISPLTITKSLLRRQAHWRRCSLKDKRAQTISPIALQQLRGRSLSWRVAGPVLGSSSELPCPRFGVTQASWNTKKPRLNDGCQARRLPHKRFVCWTLTMRS